MFLTHPLYYITHGVLIEGKPCGTSKGEENRRYTSRSSLRCLVEDRSSVVHVDVFLAVEESDGHLLKLVCGRVFSIHRCLYNRPYIDETSGELRCLRAEEVGWSVAYGRTYNDADDGRKFLLEVPKRHASPS